MLAFCNTPTAGDEPPRYIFPFPPQAGLKPTTTATLAIGATPAGLRVLGDEPERYISPAHV